MVDHDVIVAQAEEPTATSVQYLEPLDQISGEYSLGVSNIDSTRMVAGEVRAWRKPIASVASASLKGIASNKVSVRLTAFGQDQHSVVPGSKKLTVNCDDRVIGELRKLDNKKPLLMVQTFQPTLTRRNATTRFYASSPTLRSLGTCADGAAVQAPQR